MRRYILVLAVVPLTVFAAPFFKCEYGGKVSYSDMPCKDNGTRPFEVQHEAAYGSNESYSREKAKLEAVKAERKRRESRDEYERRMEEQRRRMEEQTQNSRKRSRCQYLAAMSKSRADARRDYRIECMNEIPGP